MELRKVQPGQVFTLGGVRFVRLPAEYLESILVVTEGIPTVLANVPFTDKDEFLEHSNDFRDSIIMHTVDNWLRDYTAIRDAVVSRPIDLTTMDGMTDYGVSVRRARALTIDEYRRYRRWIPPVDKPWWLATGCTALCSQTSDPYFALFIATDGTVSESCVYSSNIAARPAAYFRASAVVTVDERVDLSGVSDKEILEELARRVGRHE